MKKVFYLMGIILLTGLVLFSCSKVGYPEGDNPDAIDQNDDVFPVITVSKPTANQVYANGDSIVVEGKVTDEKKMYKGKVQIKSDATNVLVAEEYYETHFLTAINYRVAYKAVVTAATDFSILIEFQDHGGNAVMATIKVKVNP